MYVGWAFIEMYAFGTAHQITRYSTLSNDTMINDCWWARMPTLQMHIYHI